MATATETMPNRVPTRREGAIVRRKLPEEILDRLMEMIASGEVLPGERLPGERELMRRFATGRPAVREALQTLANMGVIQIQHGERARMRQLEPKGLLARMDLSVRHMLQASPENERYLWEARMMFECAMVKDAARKATPEDLQDLERAHAALVAAAGDPGHFIEVDIAFHVGIARISGNPIYPAFAESMLGWLFQCHPEMFRAPGTEPVTIQEHEAILKALQARKPLKAAEAMEYHLTRSNPAYIQTAGQPAGNPAG
jgi:GntR family transcriptional regulator, sialic acid-inducible nan operon repressor